MEGTLLRVKYECHILLMCHITPGVQHFPLNNEVINEIFYPKRVESTRAELINAIISYFLLHE